MEPRMHTSGYDLAAYVAAGVSLAAASVEPSGLDLANQIVDLIGGIIGALSGVGGIIYFIHKWRKRK